MDEWKPMSEGYKFAFLAVGVFSLTCAAGFMVLGGDPKLTVAMACCGGAAFAYIHHRTSRPTPEHKEE